VSARIKNIKILLSQPNSELADRVGFPGSVRAHNENDSRLLGRHYCTHLFARPFSGLQNPGNVRFDFTLYCECPTRVRSIFSFTESKSPRVGFFTPRSAENQLGFQVFHRAGIDLLFSQKILSTVFSESGGFGLGDRGGC